MRPPAPLKARLTFLRCFVCASRICQVFSLERIKSSQGFFTISNIFAERRRALLLQAFFFFCPVVVLPLLPRTPLPRAVVVLPPNTFLFEFAHDAPVLKQSLQNFARREAASFLQCGLLHLLLALVFVSIMAATGVLKRGRYSGRNGYGVSCGSTCLTMTRFLHLIGHTSNCVQYPYEYANPGKCKPWPTGFRYCPPVLVLMCCCWFCSFLFLCDF